MLQRQGGSDDGTGADGWFVVGILVAGPKRGATPAGPELVTMRRAENQRRLNCVALAWEGGETRSR